MAFTTNLSNSELARVAAAAYEGLAVRVSLHNKGATGFDQNSTIANWDTVKLAAANGYADFVLDPLPAGGYDATDGRYEMGGAGANTYITASFTGAGSGFTYNTVVIRIASATYPHSIISESPSVSVAPGATQTYTIQLLAAKIA
jgi:hypothetical protein